MSKQTSVQDSEPTLLIEQLEHHRKEVKRIEGLLSRSDDAGGGLITKIRMDPSVTGLLELKLLENVRDMVFLLDREGCVLFANPYAEGYYGMDLSTMMGIPIEFFWCGKSIEHLQNTIKEVRESRIEQTLDCTCTNSYYELKISPFIEDGVFMGMTCVARDITEKTKLSLSLNFERQQLLSLFNSISESIYVSDPHTHDVLFVNRYLRNILVEDPVGKKCYNVFQGRDSVCEFCTNNIILNNNNEVHVWEFHNEMIDRHFMIFDRLMQTPDGKDARFEMAIDITDKLMAEREVYDKSKKLKYMAGRLISMQEEERSRIARELHDELGQRLTSLSMKIECLRGSHHVTDKEVDSLSDLVENVNIELHRIYQGLWPVIIDRFGLTHALMNLAKEFKEKTGFTVNAALDSFGQSDIPSDLAINIYRIVQEALNNAARHSMADSVKISLNRRVGRIHLRIMDNGRGFDIDKVNRENNFGLQGMMERADIHDGKFRIKTSPDKGTVISIFF